MKTIQCAICKEKQQIKTLYNENFDISKIDSKTFSARRIPDKTHFRFVICERCGLIFSNPILEEKKIHRFYNQSDFTYAKETKYLANTYLSYLEKHINKMNLKKVKILDIGCGNGFFLEKALDRGFEKVYGVEPGRSSVLKSDPKVRKNIIIDIFRDGLFKKNYFDIICCFHTLDHIVDPNEFISSAKKILKKNGLVFFVVHTTDGLSVKMLGEKSPIFDIEHIYLFNKKTLTKIFKKQGFKGVKIMDISNKYPISYWIHLFPIPDAIKKIILKILFLTKLGMIPLSIQAGNIGIIAKKVD